MRDNFIEEIHFSPNFGPVARLQDHLYICTSNATLLIAIDPIGNYQIFLCSSELERLTVFRPSIYLILKDYNDCEKHFSWEHENTSRYWPRCDNTNINSPSSSPWLFSGSSRMLKSEPPVHSSITITLPRPSCCRSRHQRTLMLTMPQVHRYATVIYEVAY